MGELKIPACSKCQDTLYIEKVRDGQVKSWACDCLKRRMLFSFLGPELSRVRHRQSDLFKPTVDPATGHSDDRTLDNLFIKGTWSEVAQHLRWTLAAKKWVAPAFTFKMVTDERLLRVYLGDFAYTRRSAKVRDEIETFNSLADVIEGCALLIIRLGKLHWKNRAAADVLLEALSIRDADAKPTWLIEGERFFGDGHPSYSDMVGRYIETNFDVVDLGGDVKAAQAVWQALTEVSMDSILAEGDASPVFESKERFSAESGTFGRKKKWRKGGGSGLPGGL